MKELKTKPCKDYDEAEREELRNQFYEPADEYKSDV